VTAAKMSYVAGAKFGLWLEPSLVCGWSLLTSQLNTKSTKTSTLAQYEIPFQDITTTPNYHFLVL
jgi:hypothetical protein